MTLQSSGAISFSNINVELSLTSTAQISLNDTAVRSLAGVASGAISMSNFYGKSFFTYEWGGALPAWAGTFPSQTAGSLSAASLSVVINRTAGSGTITPVVTSTPSGWTTTVAPTSATLSASPSTQTFTVTVTPASGATAGTYNGSITFRDYAYGWSMVVQAAPSVTFTPAGGTSAGTAEFLISDLAYMEAEVVISCSQVATWNHTRTVSTGGGTQFVSVANGGSSSSIIFRLDSEPPLLARRVWSVSATAGGVTRYWTVELRSDYT